MELIHIERKVKTPKQAREAIGRFSEPSKMPCYAWSISAEHCITGKKLAKIHNSVCRECYALKSFYMLLSTKNAMNRRENTLQNRKDFVENFILALQNEEHFRWFDSGDIQSLEMLEDIVSIAKQTPNVKHWLPTKEALIVARYLESGKKFPSNLTVRISAYIIDSENASNVTGLKSLVFTPKKFAERKTLGVFYCKAPEQEKECKDCRACWNQEIETIVYKKH